MGDDHNSTEQVSVASLSLNCTRCQTKCDTKPSDKSLFPIRALSFVFISVIIGREIISLVLEVVLLAWAIDRLECYSIILDRRAADRQARLEDVWEKNLRQLSEIVDIYETDLLRATGTVDDGVNPGAGDDDTSRDSRGETEDEVDRGEEGGVYRVVEEEEDGEDEGAVVREGEKEVECESEEDTEEEVESKAADSEVFGEVQAARLREELVSDERDGGRESQTEDRALQAPSEPQRVMAEYERANTTAPREQVPHDAVITPLPSPLLDHDPCATCIGITQKGSRCQNSFIAASSKRAATNRIEIMKSANPGNSFEWEPLKELADWMLCPGWHRDKIPQGRDIADRWYAELAPAR